MATKGNMSHGRAKKARAGAAGQGRAGQGWAQQGRADLALGSHKAAYPALHQALDLLQRWCCLPGAAMQIQNKSASRQHYQVAECRQPFSMLVLTQTDQLQEESDSLHCLAEPGCEEL